MIYACSTGRAESVCVASDDSMCEPRYDCVVQALLILVFPGFLRHALRSNRPDLPVTDANGQYIAGGGAAGGASRFLLSARIHR